MTVHTDTGGARAAKAAPHFDRNLVIQWGIAAITMMLVVLPLLPVFYQAFLDRPLYDSAAALTASNFGRLVTPEFGEVIGNTAWFAIGRSEEHTSELQSLMRISYAVFCLKKKTN